MLHYWLFIIYILQFAVNFTPVTCFPMVFGMYPYFPPYYPQNGMMPQMPMSPFSPWLNPSMPPAMTGAMPPIVTSPSHLSVGHGAESNIAALNLPIPQDPTGENITAQIGNSIQLPQILQKTNIPLKLLSSEARVSMDPQTGTFPIQVPASNEPVKTAPMPMIYK